MAVDDHFAAAVTEMRTLAVRFEIACADSRAEGGVRHVALSGDTVSIERRVVGIAMNINVPTNSYRGVVLAAARAEDGGTGRFHIRLSHEDRSLEVMLHDTADDSDVIALWRAYGERLSLPLLVEDAEGRLQPVERLAGHGVRRQGSAVRGRRPRFLVRRQPGCRDEAFIRQVTGPAEAH
jgi:hypothetical protein